MANIPPTPLEPKVTVGPTNSNSPNRILNFFLGNRNVSATTDMSDSDNMTITYEYTETQLVNNNALGLQASKHAPHENDNMEYTSTNTLVDQTQTLPVQQASEPNNQSNTEVNKGEHAHDSDNISIYSNADSTVLEHIA